MYLIPSILGGTIPILLIAWLVRRLFRAPITAKSAAASVAFALVVGIVLYGFGEGDGGFQDRMANIGSLESFLIYVPAAILAFALTYLFGLGRKQNNSNEGE